MIEAIENRDYLLIKKEKEVLKQLCFNEFRPDIFKFNEGNYILFMDYRKGKRKSWIIDINSPRKYNINKEYLEIYRLFKRMIKNE